MSGVLDRAKAHYASLDRGSIEIEEWGENGKPLVVTWVPLTVAERRRIYRSKTGQDADGATAVVRTVMLKACDKDGNRLFSEMDERALSTEVDSSILMRIASAILDLQDGVEATVDDQVDAEKNG